MIRVVAALIEKDGKYLIAKRATGSSVALGKWEFPGGKVEQEESDEDAIKREIKEELDIEIDVIKFIKYDIYEYPDKTVDLNLYECKYLSGDIKLNDHSEYLFLDKDEIINYDLVPADIRLARYINSKTKKNPFEGSIDINSLLKVVKEVELGVGDLTQLECIENNINLDEYIEFREFVKSHMEHPDWLGDFSKEDLENVINGNGKLWIYYKDNKPVCSMMIINATENSLSKFNIDLPVNEVIDYGPMFVHPDYWGNRLQYKMLEELDNYCINLGYKYAISTVHPDNIYSNNNLLRNGFKISSIKEFKRGTRYVYIKELKK